MGAIALDAREFTSNTELSLPVGGSLRRSYRSNLQFPLELHSKPAESLIPSRSEIGFVKTFRKMIVQIWVLEQSSDDGVGSEHLRFSHTTMPLFCSYVALTEAHQCVEFSTRYFGK
jgi:hypothetical protein